MAGRKLWHRKKRLRFRTESRICSASCVKFLDIRLAQNLSRRLKLANAWNSDGNPTARSCSKPCDAESRKADTRHRADLIISWFPHKRTNGAWRPDASCDSLARPRTTAAHNLKRHQSSLANHEKDQRPGSSGRIHSLEAEPVIRKYRAEHGALMPSFARKQAHVCAAPGVKWPDRACRVKSCARQNVLWSLEEVRLTLTNRRQRQKIRSPNRSCRSTASILHHVFSMAMGTI